MYECECKLYFNFSIFPHTKLSSGFRRLDSNPFTGIILKRVPGQDENISFCLPQKKENQVPTSCHPWLTSLANVIKNLIKSLPHTFVTLLGWLCKNRAHCLEQAGMKCDISWHAHFFLVTVVQLLVNLGFSAQRMISTC